MTAPMVLIMFCLSLCFVDSSNGRCIEYRCTCTLHGGKW